MVVSVLQPFKSDGQELVFLFDGSYSQGFTSL